MVLLLGGTRHMSTTTTTKTHIWITYDSKGNSHAFETKKSALNCARVFKESLLGHNVTWNTMKRRKNITLFQPTNDFTNNDVNDLRPIIIYYNQWVIIRKCEISH